MRNYDVYRDELLAEKAKRAKTFPLSVCTVNFLFDENLGFVVRAAACFGAKEVHVIGSLPKYRILRQLSCSTSKYIKITQHKHPRDFILYAYQNDIKLVSCELTDDSVPLHSYEFPTDQEVCLITGHESHGTPASLIHNSDVVEIPIPGVGTSLNTSQAINIALYEYVRQMEI